MTVEWEEGFSIRVDFEKDKKIGDKQTFFVFRLSLYSANFDVTYCRDKKSAVRRNFSA